MGTGDRQLPDPCSGGEHQLVVGDCLAIREADRLAVQINDGGCIAGYEIDLVLGVPDCVVKLDLFQSRVTCDQVL